ncbi:ricin-type beta-trefoil lectin domain protein [Kitasatospora phosalacinea]|uniref:ricin-type beta-trefoil lectin domain protein n=1 Tax=Kitasatospora phosalacinea TaxID=2065 RepID=UPI003660C611
MAAAAALLLAALPAPFAAAAAPTPAPGAAATPGTAAESPAESEQTAAVRAALQQAQQTGRPVKIDALTTELAETFAATDGRSLYSENHVQPVRTKRSGNWQTLDPVLRRAGDGSVRPAVTDADLVLSGGGSGPLATVTTADGKQLSLSAPFALPAPTLDGATATYPDVLPDVDLQVTARSDGGWRDVVVVKTAQAAADPRLRELHFPIRTTGLTPGADAAGNVSLTDGSGTVRFQAPTPFQWDSTRPGPQAPEGGTAKAAAKSLFAAPAAADGGAADSAQSSAEQPGAAAVVAPMGVSVSATELVLTPDRNSFGKGTGPWYLDPEVGTPLSKSNNAQVQENHPGTATVNTASPIGVGYCGYDNCTGYGRYRAYYQFGVPSGLMAGNGHGTATITSATMEVRVTDASDASVDTTFDLYSTPAFNGNPTWYNQPCGYASKMQGCTWAASDHLKNVGTLEFNVKDWVQYLVNNQVTPWTVGIATSDEYNKGQRHHLAPDPVISVYYDIAPTIWGAGTSPTPGFVNDPQYGTRNDSCQHPGGNPWYAPGWVGGNQYIRLQANIWSPINASVNTTFHIWDDNDPNYSGLPSTGWLGGWGTVGVPVGQLVDGHQYGWAASTTDQFLGSGDTPWCYFRVDKTAPQVTVTSTDFPASGVLGQFPAKKLGDTGTFSLAATDPPPAGGLNASGVACLRWSTDPTPVTGWKCTDPTGPTSGTFSGAKGDLGLKPVNWGTNSLYVQAMDVAGNYSQPARYTFYVPWNPANGTAGTPGDLNGDGRGDILLPDDLGNLRTMSLDSDPSTAQAAPLELFPGGYGFKDGQTRITHRGALRSALNDDVLAWSSATPDLATQLYDFPNNNDGTIGTPTPLLKNRLWANPDGTALGTAPAGWSDDWSNLQQVVALGAPNAPLTKGDNIVRREQSAVLTVEGGNLWLYRASTTDHLDAPAVLVSGTGTWNGYELVNPGAAGGTAQPTLWTRDKGDGTLRAYDVKLKADGTLDLSAFAAPTGPGARVLGGPKLTTAAYPKLGSSGDADKDGVTDLWTVDVSGRLQIWTGSTTDGTPATAVTALAGTGADQGSARRPVERYRMQGTAADGTLPGYYPGSVAAAPTGAVSFPADTVDGAATTVASFGGNAAPGRIEADSQGRQFRIDTGKSFTATVWAKPSGTTAQGAVLSTRGASSSGLVLAPGADGNWQFKLATSDTAQGAFDTTGSTLSNAARWQDGRWDRLTVSYNATTRVMSLYVNGALAGVRVHAVGFALNGTLVIGAAQQGGGFGTAFSGRIGDVAVYDTPTDAGSATGPLLLDTAGNKCADDPNSSDQAGQILEIWDCNGSAAQQFTVKPNGTLKIMTHCVEAVGAATGNGTRLQLADCTGSTNQQWIVGPDGSLLHVLSGRCLDLPNGDTTNGTLLELYDCNQSYAQRWRTTPVA